MRMGNNFPQSICENVNIYKTKKTHHTHTLTWKLIAEFCTQCRWRPSVNGINLPPKPQKTPPHTRPLPTHPTTSPYTSPVDWWLIWWIIVIEWFSSSAPLLFLGICRRIRCATLKCFTMSVSTLYFVLRWRIPTHVLLKLVFLPTLPSNTRQECNLY